MGGTSDEATGNTAPPARHSTELSVAAEKVSDDTSTPDTPYGEAISPQARELLRHLHPPCVAANDHKARPTPILTTVTAAWGDCKTTCNARSGLRSRH